MDSISATSVRLEHRISKKWERECLSSTSELSGECSILELPELIELEELIEHRIGCPFLFHTPVRVGEHLPTLSNLRRIGYEGLSTLRHRSAETLLIVLVSSIDWK